MSFYFEGLDGGQSLVYANRDEALGGPVAATQEWRQYKILFNSLSNSRLALFFGVWSKTGSGAVWFDDADIHEVRLQSVVWRDSLPVVVTSQDGQQRYREVADCAMMAGRLTIPKSSAIADGSSLKVSWYQRADMVSPPFASAAHPEHFQIARKIAEKLDILFLKPRGFAMTYDEWRIANWDPAGGNISAGEYVAETTRKTISLFWKINPRYEIYVWSDMYNPNHNAFDKYFMVNGSLAGSWKGLARDTNILTWYGGVKTLKFFSDLHSNRVISGYYESTDNVTQWLNDLDKAEDQGARGVDGFMYTTWEDRYDDLEKGANMIKARTRWGATQ